MIRIDWDDHISRETLQSIRPNLIKDVKKLTANELDLATKNSRLKYGNCVEIPEDVKRRLSLGKRVKKMINFNESSYGGKESVHAESQRNLTDTGGPKYDIDQLESLLKKRFPYNFNKNSLKKQERCIIICLILSFLFYVIFIILKFKSII